VPPVVHHAIDVDATPEACWKLFADVRTWPGWFPMLKEARVVGGSGDGWQVGARLELVFGVGAVGVPVKTTVEELQPARRVRWKGGALGITGDHCYLFESTGPGRTRVTSHEELTGIGTHLLRRVVMERIDREVHKSMARFKALVERAAR
jgi:hypothetical protein